MNWKEDSRKRRKIQKVGEFNKKERLIRRKMNFIENFSLAGHRIRQDWIFLNEIINKKRTEIMEKSSKIFKD